MIYWVTTTEVSTPLWVKPCGKTPRSTEATATPAARASAPLGNMAAGGARARGRGHPPVSPRSPPLPSLPPRSTMDSALRRRAGRGGAGRSQRRGGAGARGGWSGAWSRRRDRGRRARYGPGRAPPPPTRGEEMWGGRGWREGGREGGGRAGYTPHSPLSFPGGPLGRPLGGRGGERGSEGPPCLSVWWRRGRPGVGCREPLPCS